MIFVGCRVFFAGFSGKRRPSKACNGHPELPASTLSAGTLRGGACNRGAEIMTEISSGSLYLMIMV